MPRVSPRDGIRCGWFTGDGFIASQSHADHRTRWATSRCETICKKGKMDYLMYDDSIRHQCPTCGRKTLQVQRLSDGSSEMICMDLNCDFGEIVPDHGGSIGGSTVIGDGSFETRVHRLGRSHLADMAANLSESVTTLSGRAKVIVRRSACGRFGRRGSWDDRTGFIAGAGSLVGSVRRFGCLGVC